MKIKLLFLISVFVLSYTTGFSQTEINIKKNKFEISTGFNSGSLKNLEYSPVSRYDYNGLIYKLRFVRNIKNQNLFEVQLDYLNSELKTDLIPALNLDYSKMGLNISYLKKVYTKNNFSIHLGLQSQSSVSVYSKTNNNRSIVNQTFGIASRFSYQINEKQKLSSKLTIPMVIFRFTDSSSGIYSLNRYQSILWNIGYEYSLSNRFDAILSYDFNYDRLQIPNAFREVQYQLNLGLNFKF
jgi:predicted porin